LSFSFWVQQEEHAKQDKQGEQGEQEAGVFTVLTFIGDNGGGLRLSFFLGDSLPLVPLGSEDVWTKQTSHTLTGSLYGLLGIRS
jgi:hypothetical protein